MGRVERVGGCWSMNEFGRGFVQIDVFLVGFFGLLMFFGCEFL